MLAWPWQEELRRVRGELLTLKAAGVGDQYSLTAGASFDPPLAESSPMGDLQQERDKWRARCDPHALLLPWHPSLAVRIG